VRTLDAPAVYGVYSLTMTDPAGTRVGVPTARAVSSVLRAISPSREDVLGPARAQTDRLVLGLLIILTLLTLALAPYRGTWLIAAMTGPGVIVAFTALCHYRPGTRTTRLAAGLALQILVVTLIYQGGGRDEPHLLFFLTTTALIAYQDWRCLWPGTLYFCVLLGLVAWTQNHELEAIGETSRLATHDLLYAGIVLAHTGMCSVCAAILRRRTLHAAAVTADLEHARQDLANALAVRERTAIDLAQARDRAEALARTKADFLATMSHELRTPLNGILGMSHLLAETDLDSEQREMLDAVLVSSDALLDIIGDVLDYSKMEAGRLTIDPLPCDLRRVCEAVFDIVAPKAEEKDLVLILRYTPEVPRRMIADAARVRQILLNLLSNAVKFTAVGSIQLTVTVPTPGIVRFALVDTGIGVTPAQRARLFEPFVQAEEGTTRTYGGTGLGLAISKRLVELMHGTIGVESELGAGSTFWCELPLQMDRSAPTEGPLQMLSGQQVQVVDAHVGRRDALCELLASGGLSASGCTELPATLTGQFAILIDDGIPGALEWLKAQESLMGETRCVLLTSFAAGRTPPPPGRTVLRKPVHADALFQLFAPVHTRRVSTRTPLPEALPIPTRGAVLLADDHYLSLQQAEQLIRRAGYVVTAVSDGVQALRQARERPYDLILVDAQLPDLDAGQLASSLRTGSGPNQLTPVIAVGGSATGVEDTLERPLAMAPLSLILERWAGRRVAPTP
jgi:signal transduction histidine kinase/CheY-like chemotaxis protein